MQEEAVSEAANAAARKLGYAALKLQQQEAVVNFLSGRDVFAVLPTGYGKSLCYALLPLAFDLLEINAEKNANCCSINSINSNYEGSSMLKTV